MNQKGRSDDTHSMADRGFCKDCVDQGFFKDCIQPVSQILDVATFTCKSCLNEFPMDQKERPDDDSSSMEDLGYCKTCFSPTDSE